MATIEVCDRCGNQINPASSVTYCEIGTSRNDLGDRKELCCSCAMWLKKYLDGEAMVLRQKDGEEQ